MPPKFTFVGNLSEPSSLVDIVLLPITTVFAANFPNFAYTALNGLSSDPRLIESATLGTMSFFER